MAKQKKQCGDHWRHQWVVGRCIRCGRYNPIEQQPYERFWDLVNPFGKNGCWLWIGSLHEDGYGLWRISDRTMRAHRYAWFLMRGEIPEGKELDHICRVRNCVNVSHLQPLSHGDNIRGALLKPVCGRGHRMTPENLYFNKKGYRRCKACIKQNRVESIRRSRAR